MAVVEVKAYRWPNTSDGRGYINISIPRPVGWAKGTRKTTQIKVRP